MKKQRKKSMGLVGYYVERTATNNRTKRVRVTKFGPFASLKEAETKRLEDEEVLGDPGVEYEYRVVVASNILPK